MTMKIITGYTGTKHITPVDDGRLNKALFGDENYVLPTGNQLAATIQSATEVRIADGELIMQGRYARNDSGYESLVINNGSQGMYRNDLIVARYTKDASTSVESIKLVVITGTPDATSATDPDYNTGNIENGETRDFPLYRVCLNGVNLSTIETLFDVWDRPVAGWGYGGAMDFVQDTDGAFESKLNEILATMPNTSAKQIQFYDTKGLIDGKFVGTLWRYTSSYATLEGVNYRGEKALKCMYDGVWGPWEWENPPMSVNTEYRTTKRLAGKPVYVAYLNIGTLPSSGNTTFTIGASGDAIESLVSLRGFAYNKSNDYAYEFPFISTNGNVVGSIRKTGKRTFSLIVDTDLSGYTGKVYVEYTKA